MTVPVPCDVNTTEALGDFIKFGAQEGYLLKEAEAITEERGTQRDPWRVTVGFKAVLRKP